METKPRKFKNPVPNTSKYMEMKWRYGMGNASQTFYRLWVSSAFIHFQFAYYSITLRMNVIWCQSHLVVGSIGI